MNTHLKRLAGRGALLSLAAGVLALGTAFLAAWRCLPFHISQPPPPWPWVCSEPASGVIRFLAFPVNLMTDDLSQAVRLAPVSLALYVLLGTGLALLLGRGFARPSPIPCPYWLGWLVERDNPLFKVNSSRQILLHLHLQTGMKVLDLGCGPGRLTIPTARQVGPMGRVTAFDLQEQMLRKVRQKAGREKLDNIDFVQGAIGEGKLEKETYDRVLLVTVLGELPDQSLALQEIFACLKPGGLLSITEVIADPHFQSRGKVRKVAGAAGFREAGFFGSGISYTINFERSPNSSV